jgi:hypothetical protein
MRQHGRQASLGFSRTALEGAGTTGPYLGVIGVGRSAADSVAECPLTCNRVQCRRRRELPQGATNARMIPAPRDRHEVSAQLLP